MAKIGGIQTGMMGGADGKMGMIGGADGQMDMKSMCEMHNKMMSSRTPELQRAMTDEHMKSMSPDERKKQFEMMTQHCK